jgi:hypothetical protein
VILFSLAAAAVILAASWIGHRYPRGSGLRIGLAVLAALASASVIVAVMRSIRRLDEMQQRIQLDALAFSFAGTGILTAGYGFLVSAGLPNIDWGTLVWPSMVGLWVTGVLVAQRRYR